MGLDFQAEVGRLAMEVLVLLEEGERRAEEVQGPLVGVVCQTILH